MVGTTLAGEVCGEVVVLMGLRPRVVLVLAAPSLSKVRWVPELQPDDILDGNSAERAAGPGIARWFFHAAATPVLHSGAWW